jgi:hypothetical protein
MHNSRRLRTLIICLVMVLLLCLPALAQLTDQTQAPNTVKVGIAKSLQDETGAGRGDVNTWNSSIFIIQRDPFRSIRRGRQLFQRKFTHLQGLGANEGDGLGSEHGRRDRRWTRRQLCALPRPSARVRRRWWQRPHTS